MDAHLLSFLATVEPSQAITWAALIPALISAFAMLRGNGSGSDSGSSTAVTSATTDPNMTAILDLQRRRMEMQNPLYEAVQRLAMGLMPTAYQTGNNYNWGAGTYSSTIGGGGSGAGNGPGGGSGGGSDSNGYPIPGGGGGTNEGGPDPQPFSNYPWQPLVEVPNLPVQPVRPWSPEGLRRPIVRPLGRDGY